jgi:hypothetical protein
LIDPHHSREDIIWSQKPDDEAQAAILAEHLLENAIVL